MIPWRPWASTTVSPSTFRRRLWSALGGGPDREQRCLAPAELMNGEQLHAYVEDGGVLLGHLRRLLILGHEWLLGDEVQGLGIVDVTTERAAGGPATGPSTTSCAGPAAGEAPCREGR